MVPDAGRVLADPDGDGRSIAYRGPAEPLPRTLVVERMGETLWITWPAPPPWAAWIGIGCQIGAAVAKAALLVAVISMFRRLAPQRALAEEWHLLPWVFVVAMSTHVAVIIAWILVAVHTFRRHRRWGNVPMTLVVGSQKIERRWLGHWQMRRRCWPSSRVTGVQWRQIKDVFAGKTIIVRVTVRFANARPLRFRLATRDAEAVERARVGLTGLLPSAAAS